MNKNEKLILLSNDDGIRSPGLWAAAESLSELGYVVVAAPREQQSAMGRSFPHTLDRTINKELMNVRGQDWEVYAINGSPAQCVSMAITDILPRLPDLVVTGINYGENAGSSITISGTVGAALEGASFGVPALAVSLQTEPKHHFSYSKDVDFSAAAFFTKMFGSIYLNGTTRSGYDVLKIDVPTAATKSTPWEITRVSRQKNYYQKRKWSNKQKQEPVAHFYSNIDQIKLEEDSDVHVLHVKEHVAVAPITLDLTAPVDRTLLKTQIAESLTEMLEAA